MPYPADLQRYIDAEHAVGSEQFFSDCSLVDYTAYTWAYISYFLDRLAQARLTPQEDNKFVPNFTCTLAKFHEHLSPESADDYANPRTVARFFVEQIVRFRAQTLPYYATPDLTILDDDTVDGAPITDATRRAFWIGWGI